MLAVDLGLVEYDQALKIQKSLVAARIGGTLRDHVCLMLEHPPVFTLGRRGGREFFVCDDTFLRQKNIRTIETGRGGVLTYHGPGQLVVYPLVHLGTLQLSVKEFVYLLEELMLKTSEQFGVKLNRDPRNTGVWKGDCKAGSIGIAVRKGVTYHGLALNVSLDLEPFSWINPCGLDEVRMTSLEKETGKTIFIADVKKVMLENLARLLKVDVIEKDFDQLSVYCGEY